MIKLFEMWQLKEITNLNIFTKQKPNKINMTKCQIHYNIIICLGISNSLQIIGTNFNNA